ncbi:MAG TPA: hypothetical protein VFQ61_15650 [Polyangiaceae bacterium]|nr:hypothetical protein [Polyangiaceae bacterium]
MFSSEMHSSTQMGNPGELRRTRRIRVARWGYVGLIGAVLGLGCQPATPPAESAANASTGSGADEPGTGTTPDAAETGAQGHAASASASGDASKPSDTSKPGGAAAGGASASTPPTLVQLCEQGCTKISKSCSETAVETCRMNCTQYEHPPAGCEEDVRKSLECARDAPDVTCVNIAPESCAYEFRRVVACANGKPMPAQEDPLKPPDGWERFASKSAGFSAMLPKGVTESTVDGVQTFTVKQSDATYSVRLLPPPKEKPTQKNLVFVAYKIVGTCNRNLKIYGLFEKPDRVFTRSDANCPDGGEYRGALVITPSKMYALSVLSPKGAKPPRDPFLYAFELNH